MKTTAPSVNVLKELYNVTTSLRSTQLYLYVDFREPFLLAWNGTVCRCDF